MYYGSVYVPLVRFSHFVRYQEKRDTTSWTVFLIPRALRKTKNDSCFIFRFSHSTRNEKNEWRHCRFSFFALPEMRNTKNASWRISFSLLPVIWLVGSIDGSSYWRGYHVATGYGVSLACMTLCALTTWQIILNGSQARYTTCTRVIVKTLR